MPYRMVKRLSTPIVKIIGLRDTRLPTLISGVPDVVRESETGFLSGSHNPSETATGIDAIFPRDNLVDVSHRDSSLTEAEYSFQAAVERYNWILEAVIG